MPEQKIRGENPPQIRIEELKTYDTRYQSFQTLFYGGAIIIGVAELLAALAGAYWLVIIFIIIAVVAWSAYFKDADQKIKAEGAQLRKPIFLDAYNTDFTCPLADRSVIRLTVHFQIPRELNMPSAYGDPQSSHFVEQLNRVTEAKLVMYAERFTDPPSKTEIREHLHLELAQFQNENNVPVLRVDIPIAIHVHPEKPKGVNV